MNPPAGRIQVGDTVAVPGGGKGRVVSERLIQSNGAWKYTIALEQGGQAEHLDFEITKVASDRA